MTEPLATAHAIAKLPAQDLDRARQPPEQGPGERGALFWDSEENLLVLGQPT